MNVEINSDYELTYWRESLKNPDTQRHAYKIAATIFKLRKNLNGTVVDLGCGPINGVFNILQFPRMIAIDPLWEQYNKEFGVKDEKVIKIIGSSSKFNWMGRADSIFSMNALDHSGDLGKSAWEIRYHLKQRGTFILHVHMRTKEELNAGHNLVFTEEDIDKAFGIMKQKWKKIYDKCPIYGSYKTYVACWENVKV